MTTKTCANPDCGKEFDGSAQKMYCSAHCAGHAKMLRKYARLGPRPVITRQCVMCPTVFEVKPAHPNQICCCHACSRKWNEREKREEMDRIRASNIKVKDAWGLGCLPRSVTANAFV